MQLKVILKVKIKLYAKYCPTVRTMRHARCMSFWVCRRRRRRCCCSLFILFVWHLFVLFALFALLLTNFVGQASMKHTRVPHIMLLLLLLCCMLPGIGQAAIQTKLEMKLPLRLSRAKAECWAKFEPQPSSTEAQRAPRPSLVRAYGALQLLHFHSPQLVSAPSVPLATCSMRTPNERTNQRTNEPTNGTSGARTNNWNEPQPRAPSSLVANRCRLSVAKQTSSVKVWQQRFDATEAANRRQPQPAAAA